MTTVVAPGATETVFVDGSYDPPEVTLATPTEPKSGEAVTLLVVLHGGVHPAEERSQLGIGPDGLGGVADLRGEKLVGREPDGGGVVVEEPGAHTPAVTPDAGEGSLDGVVPVKSPTMTDDERFS